MILRNGRRSVRYGMAATVALFTLIFLWTAALSAQSTQTAQPAQQITPPPAAAQPAGNQAIANAPALDLATGAMPRIMELYNTSPIINSAILALSVLSLLMFLYFMLTISSYSLAKASFVDDVKNMVIKKRYDDAAALCRAHHRMFIATIIQRCVENAGKEHSVILDMIDSEGRRRADIIWNRISYLSDIANIAPMLGLLGTVAGMIQAFFVLPSQSASINSRALAQAVGAAMSTTMFGLAVAILTVIFYSIVRSRVTRALADAEQVIHSVADHIKRGGA